MKRQSPFRTISDLLKRTKAVGSCLEWQGAKNRGGYGNIGYRGRYVAAHRLSWVLSNGAEIPHGLLILHSCDNRICINPKHLRPGTHAENAADRELHGKSFKGESGAMAKLTWEKVNSIRTEWAENPTTLATVGRKYGVCEATIHHIVKRKTWK